MLRDIETVIALTRAVVGKDAHDARAVAAA